MDAEQANVGPLPRRAGIGRLLVIAVVVLFLGLLAYGLVKKSPDDTIDSQLKDGKTAAAPAFSLELLTPGTPAARSIRRAAADGKVGIDELRGTPVVLNFWASWCDPCADESPVLERGWQRWKRRGVLFLGLDMQDLREDARSFLSQAGVSYPSVRDSGKKTSKHYGATGIPETYFITRGGDVVAHVVGAVSAQQLESGIAAARSGRPVGKEAGGARRPPR